MAQAQSLSVPQDCFDRAREFDDSAVRLLDDEDEWGAVLAFYASYHRARGAILADPVFDSFIDLPKVDPRLQKEHQTTSRHEGRMSRGGRDLGVNDLVRMLYRPIYGDYLTLHDASVNVRYAKGISSERRLDARQAWSRIKSAQERGAMQWAGRAA